MEKKTITLFQEETGIVAYDNGSPILDGNGTKIWANEKVAVQWIRRQAEKNKINIEIIKVNGDSLFACYAEPEHKNQKKHEWRKANVISLADGKGKYNKLFCIHCGLVARHYFARERHFLEEYSYCEGKKK